MYGLLHCCTSSEPEDPQREGVQDGAYESWAISQRVSATVVRRPPKEYSDSFEEVFTMQTQLADKPWAQGTFPGSLGDGHAWSTPATASVPSKHPSKSEAC